MLEISQTAAGKVSTHTDTHSDPVTHNVTANGNEIGAGDRGDCDPMSNMHLQHLGLGLGNNKRTRQTKRLQRKIICANCEQQEKVETDRQCERERDKEREGAKE